MTFKSGDRVVCIKKVRKHHYTNPEIGVVYVVADSYDSSPDKLSLVEGVANWFYSSQFILLEHCTPFIKALYVEKS